MYDTILPYLAWNNKFKRVNTMCVRSVLAGLHGTPFIYTVGLVGPVKMDFSWKGSNFLKVSCSILKKNRTDRAWKVAIDSFYKSCLHSKHFICTSARDIYGHVYMHRSHLKLSKVFIQLLLDFRVGITFSVNF